MSTFNILIPMAGHGSRFIKEGFKNIKPMIKLLDKTFIQWSVESLGIDGDFIFVVLQEHYFLLSEHLNQIAPNCKIVTVPEVTRGAAETCLAAKEYINNESSLIITNSDQIFEWDSESYIDYLKKVDPDSNVITVKSETDKFSYIQLDENGKGLKLAEKEVISNNGLVGIHYWKHGNYFVDSAEEMIKRNIRSKNEFYVSLTYNLLIENGLNVTAYELKNTDKYLSIGTPEQVYDFLDYKNLNVKVSEMSEMHRGWFIGDFEPSVYKTKDFEVGYLRHSKGEKWDYHYHAKSVEINYLIKGKMKINSKLINQGQIFTFEKYALSVPEFLEDCEIICVKIPSEPKDKIIL